MSTLSDIQAELGKIATNPPEGMPRFKVEKLEGEAEVVQVTIEGQEELPIFLSVAAGQLLCITYLFTEAEVKSEMRCEMMQAMLDMNVPMPLSSFGRTGEHFIIFGALSAKSEPEVIAEEIETLSENALEALKAMVVYLK